VALSPRILRRRSRRRPAPTPCDPICQTTNEEIRGHRCSHPIVDTISHPKPESYAPFQVWTRGQSLAQPAGFREFLSMSPRVKPAATSTVGAGPIQIEMVPTLVTPCPQGTRGHVVESCLLLLQLGQFLSVGGRRSFSHIVIAAARAKRCRAEAINRSWLIAVSTGHSHRFSVHRRGIARCNGSRTSRQNSEVAPREVFNR
jgi:hypothetical protein